MDKKSKTNPAFDETLAKVLENLWNNRANINDSNFKVLKSISEKNQLINFR